MKYGHDSRLISSSLRATRLDLDTNFHNRLGRRGSSSTAKRCQTEARSHATGGEGRGMVVRGQKFAWPTASTSKPITAATLALAKQLRPAFEGIERPVVEPVEQQAEVPSRSIPAARPSRDEHRQLLLHPNAALRGAMTRLKPKEDVVELQRLPSTVVLWDSENIELIGRGRGRNVMELLEVCFARIKQEGAWLRIYDCRRGVTDRLAVIDSLDITIVQVDDIPGQGTQSVDAQMIQDARVLLSKPGLENLVIISSDSDFNHPIEYISRQGVKVYRIGRLSMKFDVSGSVLAGRRGFYSLLAPTRIPTGPVSRKHSLERLVNKPRSFTQARLSERMRDALAQIDRVEKEVASGTPRAEAERTVQEERPSKPVQYLDSVSAWSRFKLWLLSRLEKR